MGGQNERLSNGSDALDKVIDAPSTGLSLTGCVPTEPATFHPALPPSSNVQTDSTNIIEHPSHAKKNPGLGCPPGLTRPQLEKGIQKIF